ncbi:MAG TPA: hypothetical protein VK939_00740 [Longimicrobiales bacterium]|nr:hypothetical protein [Longimicrobiales bacterium]
MSWRTIEAEGRTWQVRAVSSSPETGVADVLEFTSGPDVPPRRLALPTGSLGELDELALGSAFAQARPLGGDHYGRPGKSMEDAR